MSEASAKAWFELFAFWRTSAAYRVRVALAIKGLEADETIVDLEAGEQTGAAFLKVNPMGAIPALIDREFPQVPITQSLAILEFLEDIVPTPRLLPPGPHARVRVRALSQMLTGDTHPLITPRVRRYLTVAGFDAAAVRAWMTHWFTVGLQAVEYRLAHEADTGPYCHGDEVTMADICLASILAVTRVLDIPIAGIPTVERIMAECETLEAFARAAPLLQTGAPASKQG